MNFRQKLLTGISALAFVVLLALNVKLVQNVPEDQGVNGLDLIELTAKAQGETNPKDKKSDVCTCYDTNGYYCRTVIKCISGATTCQHEQSCFSVCPGCTGF